MWATYTERDDAGAFVAFHVVPVLRPDPEGDVTPAPWHDLNDGCQCHPERTINKHNAVVYHHIDPDEDGALPRPEIQARFGQEKPT